MSKLWREHSRLLVGGVITLVIAVSAVVGAVASGSGGTSTDDDASLFPGTAASTTASASTSAATARSGSTRLTIVYRPHGGGEPGIGVTHTWTLTCNPTGGTLPSRTTACRELAAHGNDLIHPGVQCLVIVRGGPMATVNGVWSGHRVQYVSSTCSRAWSTLRALLTGST
jgi:hypothetical protein